MTSAGVAQTTPAQRWLARLSLVLAGLAVVILLVFAGLKSLAIFVVALVAAVVSVTAAYLFLSRRGIVRWLSLVVFVLVPIAVIAVFVAAGVLWVAIVSAGVWLLAVVTARYALTVVRPDWHMPEFPAKPPARHPYLIMNLKSGGGKVDKFDLKRKAEAFGAEVFLFGESGPVDVAAVARQAVANGADLLGVAGGDGTQSLVAGIAAEHRLPFVVISAGTRNHFALDLGLNREDPSTCLAALADGVELRIDLGQINGETFVNNASFGAYGEIVQSKAYRDDKVGTTLELLPDVLQGHRGPRLAAQVGGTLIDAPQALLVSNNPYDTEDIAGLARRARLDGGVLGVIGVKVSTAGQALDLLLTSGAVGVTKLTTNTIEITADAAQVPAGVDGEAKMLSTPVTCTTWPGALRVWVPRDRPGIPAPNPPMNWARLRRLAAGQRAPAEGLQARTGFERATGLADAVRRAGELLARTVIFDVEPLVVHWDGTQKDLDEGIARILSEIAKLPTVEVVCFSTNSARRPSVVPSAAGARVVYLASAGKPLRTNTYDGFPRPGVVVGDQVPTDGVLARRLGYAFIEVGWPAEVPAGPRLLAAGGRLLRPLLFTNPPV